MPLFTEINGILQHTHTHIEGSRQTQIRTWKRHSIRELWVRKYYNYTALYAKKGFGVYMVLNTYWYLYVPKGNHCNPEDGVTVGYGCAAGYF